MNFSREEVLADAVVPPASVTGADAELLDNAAWHSLTGPHREFAEGSGRARRYRPDISPWAAVADWDDPGIWEDILALVGPDGVFPYRDTDVEPPAGWTVTVRGGGVQLVETDALAPVVDPEVVRLGEHDVDEMLALVGRTKPGPFLPRTYLMGTYLGIRHGGRLIAMAGERLHPTGWTEISAVCTDAEYRGRGLATRLVLSVAAGIHDRGERALMHAAGGNVGAIRLYESLGFAVRRRTRLGQVRTPGR